MTAIGTADELAAAVGASFGHSEPWTIAQSDIDQFAALSGDHQWLHVDVEAAKTGPYGSTIAHGFYLLAVSGRYFPELVQLPSTATIINYGSDRTRFLAPVPVGSRLVAEVSLIGIRQTVNGSLATFRLSVLLDPPGQLAMVCDWLCLIDFTARGNEPSRRRSGG